jgi:prepilin peptidase CpaA
MGHVFTTILLAALALLLVAAGIEDARRREIANWKCALIALLAVPWWFANGLSVWPDMAWQLGIAFTVFMLFVGAFSLRMMGGGDVKLIGAVALWLPFGPLVTMLVVMSLLGGALTLLLMIEKWVKRDRNILEIPYGVAIAIAGLLALREPILNPLL